MKRIILFVIPLFFLSLLNQNVFAGCGACYVPIEGGKNRGEESNASAPMINSLTASTIGKNHATAGFAFHQTRYNSIPAHDAHELHHDDRDIHGKNHEEIYNFHLGYGITDDWDLYLSAPLVSKTSIQVDSHRYLGRGERSGGFGDMRLLTKYRFWKRYFEAAFVGGIKFPTGKVSSKDQSGAKFETEQQPGSGSWDGEFGLALSRSFAKRISLATSFQYALRGEGAQDRKLGDTFVYSIGSSFAIRELGKHPNVSIVLELNNKWMLKDHSRDADRVFDSGGMLMLISPGLMADITKNLSAFFAMPIPVSQNMGGEHEELKYELITGVNWHF